MTIYIRLYLSDDFNKVKKSFNLLSGHSLREIGDDPAQEFVVSAQADEQLELVVLAEPVASRLDAGDQSCVHSDDKNKVY